MSPLTVCVVPFVSLLLTLLLALSVSSSELTFELPDNEKLCFHEIIEKDVKCTLEYQVISGGNYDVDVELTSQSGQSLYKEVKKQYDSFTWTTAAQGEYRICFSNEFSTFTHKLVYFDFKVGEEGSIKSVLGEKVTALTQMESSADAMHENLKSIIDYQTHHRLREVQGREFAEDLNGRVQYWSLGQSVVILVVSIGQVMVLRSFFTDKRPHGSPSFVGT